jgi:organic radical activating enzyme
MNATMSAVNEMTKNKFIRLSVVSSVAEEILAQAAEHTNQGQQVELVFENRPSPKKFREILLFLQKNLPAKLWFLSMDDSIIAGVLFNLNFSRPRRAVVEIANGCNLKCDFCWTHSPLLDVKPDQQWLKKTLDVEFIYKYLDELETYGTVWLVEFCAIGDPIYHPGIWDLIQYAKSKDFSLRLSTNGTLLYPDKWDKYCEKPVDQLFMNISAGDRDTYADIHNVSPKVYDQLIVNLKHINEVRKQKGQVLNMRWINIITDKNLSNINKIIDTGLECGADYFDFRYVWVHKEFQKNIGVTASTLASQQSQLLAARDKLALSGIDNNFEDFLNSMKPEEVAHV